MYYIVDCNKGQLQCDIREVVFSIVFLAKLNHFFLGRMACLNTFAHHKVFCGIARILPIAVIR
jgi:hypothetical protein